jgi:hypothetical protein
MWDPQRKHNRHVFNSIHLMMVYGDTPEKTFYFDGSLELWKPRSEWEPHDTRTVQIVRNRTNEDWSHHDYISRTFASICNLYTCFHICVIYFSQAIEHGSLLPPDAFSITRHGQASVSIPTAAFDTTLLAKLPERSHAQLSCCMPPRKNELLALFMRNYQPFSTPMGRV